MQHFTFKMPAFFAHSVNILRGSFLGLFVFVAAFCAFAQQPMPVTGSLQVNTPYPAKWSEYAATGANLMGLNLTLNEAELGAMNVRLKLYIERNNTLIATSSDVVTGVPTLNLVPYITRQLGSLDLNPYFRFENLQGFSTPQYQQPLEDGVYRLWFEVVNATTGQRLSAPIGQSIFITLNDAPQLTQPSQGEQIVASSGSNLTFQWLSRATTALPLQYEWTVIEVPVGTTNVEALWATAAVLYRATSATNTLPRPVSNFTTGKTYAWRVQAKATSGISLFKNNGFSETFSFQMGSTCPAVTGLALMPKASDVIAVSWTGATTYYNYRVAYRKYDATTVWEWVEQATTNTFLNLTGLEAATEYEVKVGGVCANGATSFSAPLRATTLALGQIQGLNCGQMPPLPAAGTPIASLAIGDVIMSGDFPVTLTKVAGGNGNFTGEGWVKIPWMGSTKIKVTFTSIGVNTEKKLTSGFLQTAYDPNWGNILNVDGIFEGGTNVGIIRSGRDTAEFYTNFGINGIGNISWNAATGTITVTGSSGQSQTFTGVTLPTTIKDNLGQIYGVNANGTVIAIGRTVPMTMTSTELNTLSSDKGSVVFTQPTVLQKPLYAFDAYQEAYDKDVLWRTKYEKIGAYGVGRKAGAPGKPDIINASVLLTDATFKADSVRFITAKGMQYTSKSLGSGAYEVNVVGGPGGDGQELYALYPKADGKFFSLGKVAVFSYTLQKRKVVLVPVNGATVDASAMQTKLNEIYNPVSVQWEVIKEGEFRDNTWDLDQNGLDVDGSGLFSAYTADMKRLNKAYIAAKGQKKDVVYLFVLKNAKGGVTAGDMPRGKQFGYLFTESPENINLTAAHEVGHGIFKLRHPTDGYYFADNDLRDNLMYSGQTKLCKYQWDQIHDPGIVVSLFESDDDGKLEAGWWYNPAGYPVLIPAAMGIVPTDEIIAGTKLNDVLYGWKNDATSNYKAKILNGKFYGYFKEVNGLMTTDIYNDKQVYNVGDEKTVMMLRYKGNCVSDYMRTIYKVPANIPLLTAYTQGLPLITQGTLIASYRALPDPIAQKDVPVSGGCTRPSVTRTKNYTGLDGAAFDALLNKVKGMLKTDDTNPLTGGGIQLNGLIVISSDASPQYAVQASAELPTENEALLWFHYTVSTGKFELKSIKFGRDCNAKLENALKMFSDDVYSEQFLASMVTLAKQLNDPDFVFSALYRSLDYVSNIIGKAKIPEEVYDCSKTGYNKYYAKMLALGTGGMPILIWDGLKVNEAVPYFKTLTGERLTEMQFAFTCGLWNGLVGTVQSVPDLVKFVVTPLSSVGRESFGKSMKSFYEIEIKKENGEIICGKDQVFCKVWEMVKSIPSQFNLLDVNLQCKAAHNFGEIVGPVIVMCLGDEAAGTSVVSTVLGNAAKVLKWCDKVTDVFGYANKLTPNFIKRANGKLMIAVKRGTSDLLEQIDETFASVKLRATVISNNVVVEAFQLEIAKIDNFYQAMKEAIDGGRSTFDWDGKKVTITDAMRLARQVKAIVSMNLDRIKPYFTARPYLVVEENGVKKVYRNRNSRTPEDHIATIYDDRIEVHAYNNEATDRIDIASLDDKTGQPIAFKTEGENCGVFINGRWACFTGETLVHTEGGTTAIKDIKEGQQVWSYDLAKGQKVLSKVAKTMVSATKQIVKVFVGKDIIKATPEHPFYANKQWKAAKDLQKGTSILLLSGLIAFVDSVAVVDSIVPVYNFEVAETHDYFVGIEGVLVHNSCTVTDIASDVSTVTTPGNQFHRLTDVIDSHNAAAASLGVNSATFSTAITNKDWAALTAMGLQIETFGGGMKGISNGNIRYRTPITKRDGTFQGNIEVKPTGITWSDVNNKSASSPRFVNGNDTVINHHISIAP